MRPRIRYAGMRRRCRPGWRAVPARIGRSRSLRASAPWSAISAQPQARAPFDRQAPPDRRTRAGRDAKNKQRPRGFGRAQVSWQMVIPISFAGLLIPMRLHPAVILAPEPNVLWVLPADVVVHTT